MLKLLQKIKSAILIRYYLFLKKNQRNIGKLVSVVDGPLKGYNWSLFTSDETYFSGLYDSITLNTLKNNIKPGDIVYDLGANEGYLSIISSIYAGSNGIVYAFEPMPKNFEKLTTHVKSNNIKNIKVFDLAVSDSNGEIEFSDTDDLAGNTLISNSPKFSISDKRIKVQTITLDEFCEKNSEPLPNLIKIDVEGAEFKVLQGAAGVIKKSKPVIILATHDYHVPGVKNDCIAFLSELGYKHFSLNNYSDSGFGDFLFLP